MNKYLLSFHLFLFMISPQLLGRDFIIYSIVQNISMGEPDEQIRKNFYINIGEQQGVEKGATLDVYRTISRLDPYKTKQRYNYKIKIGELQVIHSEKETAIGQIKGLNLDQQAPLFEIEGLMIGDQVEPNTD